MKLNELQIGDWVSTPIDFKDGSYVYVYDRIASINIFGDYTTKEFDIEGGCEFLQPIPLTTEILRKNGLFYDPFLYDEEDCDDDNFLPQHFEEDEDHNLEIVKDKGKIYWSINCAEYYIIELRYVHQLQHALRLCGIEKEIQL